MLSPFHALAPRVKGYILKAKLHVSCVFGGIFMEKSLTLFELGMQYSQSEEKLRRRAHELRLLCSELSGDELKNVRYRILMLLSEARDCRRTAQYLKNYYSEEGKDSEKSSGLVF